MATKKAVKPKKVENEKIVVTEAATIPRATAAEKAAKKIPAKPKVKTPAPKEVLRTVNAAGEIEPPFDIEEKEAEQATEAEEIEKVAFSEGSILPQILAHVEPVDFAAEADKAKPSQNDYIVSTVREILRLVKNHGFGLVSNNGQIYSYTGKYWKVVSKKEWDAFSSAAAKLMGVPQNLADGEKFCKDVYSQLKHKGNLQEREIDQKKTLVNLGNCTFEVTAKGPATRPHSQDDFLTYVLPFDYDPKAEAPIFGKYLATSLPNKDSQRILAEFIGYVFAKDLKLDKCLLLYGEGRNGKSVFNTVIRALLGGKVNISDKGITALNHEYHRAALAGKLLNFPNEMQGDINNETFKVLACGEPVTARLPYGDPFEISNYARLAFNTNNLPKNPQLKEAYFSRFIIVPFNIIIKDEDRDPKLSEKIIASELSGVFNWVLAGLKTLLKNSRFSKNEEGEAMLQTYREESDHVFQFPKDCDYGPADKAVQPFGTIYNEFTAYLKTNGLKMISSIEFSKRLNAHGIGTKKTNKGKNLFISKKS